MRLDVVDAFIFFAPFRCLSETVVTHIPSDFFRGRASWRVLNFGNFSLQDKPLWLQTLLPGAFFSLTRDSCGVLETLLLFSTVRMLAYIYMFRLKKFSFFRLFSINS